MRLDLSVLNEEQLSAVTAEPGPLLVLAGAGTGKTRVITYRIAHLVRTGTAADRILAVTFTNRAAAEMEERLLRMYPGLSPSPQFGTFHALGNRLLRQEHARIGYRRNFPIYDESDAQEVLGECLRELAGVEGTQRHRDTARRAISRWKNRFRSPEEALDEAQDDVSFLCARAYLRYEERLTGLNAVDFDDLIYRPVRLLDADDEARSRWAQRFDAVLIDEYQDTNTAQYRFARLLAGPAENLTVVGDDDQSIYAFRGAEVEKILSFRADFPRARIVTLERNYRSVQSILDAANAVIGRNPHRHPKRLRAARGVGEKIPLLELEHEDAEAEEIVSRVLENRRRGVPLDQQAILLRSAIQARPFEEKLRFHGLPYTIIGGGSFFDRREVKDLLAYLRLLVAPEDDIALLRILNVPRRGFGTASRQKLDTWARARRVPLLDALRVADTIEGIPSAASAAGRELAAALEEAGARLASAGGLGTTRALLERIDFPRALCEITTDLLEQDFRRRGVQSVLDSLERHERREGPMALPAFLQRMTLHRADQREDEEVGKLTLLTFHGAKGLEFARVFLVGIDDDLIPHARALAEGGEAAEQEERRLFYVAVTRARDHLTLSRALCRRRFGKEFETTESRFVLEMPEALVERERVDRTLEPPADEGAVNDFIAQMRARNPRGPPGSH